MANKLQKGINDLKTWCEQNGRMDLLLEWDYEKNITLVPDGVTSGSGKKIWWKCLTCGNEWRTSVGKRSSGGTGCPSCSVKSAHEKVANNRIQQSGSLLSQCPELAEEFHSNKNGELKPNEIYYQSTKKIWWIGKCGHEWQASVSSRVKLNQDCPFCSSRILLPGFNDLLTKYPVVAKEWHPTKNGELKPIDVSAGSDKKVWWLGECGHEWQATISHRVPHATSKGTGCPYCSNTKVLFGYNDFQTNYPQLCEEWNYEKNTGLKPADFLAQSNKTVWWICQFGHEWKASIYDRTIGIGCPKCSSKGTSLPEQGIAFYLENVCEVQQRSKIAGMEIDVYLPEFNIGIEYDGRRYHKQENRYKETHKDEIIASEGITLIRIKESESNRIDNKIIYFKTDYLGSNYEWALEQLFITIFQLTNDKRFSLIRIDVKNDILKIRERVNLYLKESSLALVHPELAEEWHPFKNGILTPNMFFSGANTKVWWLGKCGHEWEAVINVRVGRNTGCPICSGHKVLSGFNDLLTKYPELASEWHPKYNNDLFPTQVTSFSNKKVWWLGKCGHEWKAVINNRVSQNMGCPFCSGREVLSGFNDLMTKYPEIAKDWHPTKNMGLMPTEVAGASNRKVWWLCSKGHEWKADIGNRTILGRGCPECGKEKQVISNNKNRILKNKSLFENYPDIAKEWCDEKNGDLKPTDVTAHSNKSVWWKCENGHEWKAIIGNRTSKGSNCPVCARSKAGGLYSLEKGVQHLNNQNSSFAYKYPELAKEWNFERNGSLLPTELLPNSNRLVWWKCDKGHEWPTLIKSRVINKTGCPYCSDKATKRVLCIETNCIYESLSEASEKVFGNVKNVTNISNVCKGKRKTAGGFHWKYL